MACFEIVDSRIRDWKIRIQDTVADNASCGVFVLGDRMVDPRELDMSTCGMVLEKNGEIVVTGAGAATLAHPLNAVAWLRTCSARWASASRPARSCCPARSAQWCRSGRRQPACDHRRHRRLLGSLRMSEAVRGEEEESVDRPHALFPPFASPLTP